MNDVIPDPTDPRAPAIKTDGGLAPALLVGPVGCALSEMVPIGYVTGFDKGEESA